MLRRVIPHVTIIPLVIACGDFEPRATEVAPGILSVEVAPDTSIEVLDWGGEGPPLLLLAGGGHTAHEFDEFAPRLTDAFRVVGITRRGIGASSEARHRVSRDRLTDVARVLDALALGPGFLAGHSQGGLEAAEFAQAYPDRCRGVIHLDSALLGGEAELAELFRTTPPPDPPERTEADLASTGALRAWIEQTQGFQLPESELRATNIIGPAGRVQGPAPRDTGPRFGWFGRVQPLEWEAVECPSIGLYPIAAPLETWLPHFRARYDVLTDEERLAADAYYRAFASWTADRREEFGRVPHNQIVEFPAAGHYFFLKQPEQARVIEAIRRFAAEHDGV